MFRIYGKYLGITAKKNFPVGGTTELIDEVETEKEARELKIEYMIAFGQDWSIWVEDSKYFITTII